MSWELNFICNFMELYLIKMLCLPGVVTFCV